nr:energy transducer TonB [uncultured Carboxylicivirga sp.]
MNDKNKRYGVIGTTVFHSLLLLFLIFFGLKTLPKGEEGILVSFGDTVLGQGPEEPKESEAVKQEQVTPPPVKTPEPIQAEPEKEDIETQDYDEAPVVKSEAQKKKEKEEKERLEKERKEREEQERIRKEELERQRQEELERKRKEEEERKRQEELDRQAAEARNKVKGAFGKGTGDNTSEGDTGGTGNQGQATGGNSTNRTGSGLGNSGNGFDLSGRSLVGTLPLPTYRIQEEGIVVVNITVDKNGYVTAADVNLKGTNTMNKELRNRAIEAAKKAKFNSDKEAAAYQQGTITYHFVLD